MHRTPRGAVRFEMAAATRRATTAGPDLLRLPRRLVVAPLPPVELRARYWDTPGLDLLARGITLRHRRDEDGTGEDLWTMTLPGGSGAPPPDHPELSWPGPGGDVPAEARQLLVAVAGDEPIGAVATMVTARQRQLVLDRSGRPLARVDDDRVTVTEPTGTVFRRIGIDLLAGDDELLDRLARAVREAGGRRHAERPDLDVALAGRRSQRPAPRLAPADPVTTLVAASLARGLEGIVAHDIDLRLGGAPRSVHRCRVACRRLRSDLRTFAPVLDPEPAGHLAGELQWWGTTLGRVRDVDVLMERLERHRRAADERDEDGYAELAVHLAARRRAVWSEARDALDGDRYAGLLADLRAAAGRPPMRAGWRPRHARSQLRRLVRRPWRRLRRTVQALPPDPSDAQLHRVRIRAKQLRYAAEAIAPDQGRHARRLARAAKRLQEELGDQHDAVVAEASLRAAAGGLDRRAVLAAGLAVAAERDVQQRRRRTWSRHLDDLERRDVRRWLRS